MSRPTVPRVTFDLPGCKQQKKSQKNENQKKILTQKNQRKEQKEKEASKGTTRDGSTFFFEKKCYKKPCSNWEQKNQIWSTRVKKKKKEKKNEKQSLKPWTLKIALRPSGVSLVLSKVALLQEKRGAEKKRIEKRRKKKRKAKKREKGRNGENKERTRREKGEKKERKRREKGEKKREKKRESVETRWTHEIFLSRCAHMSQLKNSQSRL